MWSVLRVTPERGWNWCGEAPISRYWWKSLEISSSPVLIKIFDSSHEMPVLRQSRDMGRDFQRIGWREESSFGEKHLNGDDTNAFFPADLIFCDRTDWQRSTVQPFFWSFIHFLSPSLTGPAPSLIMGRVSEVNIANNFYRVMHNQIRFCREYWNSSRDIEILAVFTHFLSGFRNSPATHNKTCPATGIILCKVSRVDHPYVAGRSWWQRLLRQQ